MSSHVKTIALTLERVIPAPLEEVFDSWLDPRIPGKPWHEASKSIFNPRVDGLFYLLIRETPHYGRFITIDRPARIQHTFVSTGLLDFSGETFVDLEVVELEPHARIVWQVTGGNLHWQTDKTEWKGTRIVWEIASKDGTTEVKMTHVGLSPDLECYDVCKPGWDFHVGTSLHKFLTDNIELTEEIEAANRAARRAQ